MTTYKPRNVREATHCKHGRSLRGYYRECIIYRKTRDPDGRKLMERKLATLIVVREDWSKMTACPKCSGFLLVDRVDDEMFCVNAGHRPGAFVQDAMSA